METVSKLAEAVDGGGVGRLGKFRRLSVVYPDFTYHLTMGPAGKIFVAKVQTAHLDMDDTAASPSEEPATGSVSPVKA